MPTESEIRKIKWLITVIAFLVISSIISVNVTPLLSIFFSFLGFVVTIYLIYYMKKIEKQWDNNK